MSKAKIVTVTAKASVYDTALAAARLTSLIPSRIIGKSSVRHQDLVLFDKIINANKTTFKPGSTISRKDLVSMFSIAVDSNPKAVGTYKDLQADNLMLVSAQRKINDVLNHNGLHVKSRDYYSSFLVCSKELTKKTVVQHSARVERMEARQSILEANIHNRVKVKKTYGRIVRVFRANGAVSTALPVRAKPTTLSSTSKAFNRVKFI
jgi:hypothetical protein